MKRETRVELWNRAQAAIRMNNNVWIAPEELTELLMIYDDCDRLRFMLRNVNDRLSQIGADLDTWDDQTVVKETCPPDPSE